MYQGHERAVQKPGGLTVIFARHLCMKTAKSRARAGDGTEVVPSSKSLTITQASQQDCSKRGAKTAPYTQISNTKMGGFMGLEKRTTVWGLKMKLFLLITTKIRQVLVSSALLLLGSGSVITVTSAYGADDLSNQLPYYNSKEFTPHWIENGSEALNGFHQIPPFSFTNQDGEEVSEKDFDNKIYVAGFFFSTCPGICPMIRSKLAKVQEAFIDDDNVKILQHSIRPHTDTVELLKAYADKNGIVSGKWYLATGERDAIYSLAKSAYFASDDLGNLQNTEDFLHTESLLLIDKNRHIRGIYNGLNSASVDYLISDIEALKAE
jgi:protein SCO1/2